MIERFLGLCNDDVIDCFLAGSGGSYLPKQNGHPPQQQYAGYHGNTSLPTYPERSVSN
jgi:hypothetical protein